MSKNQKNNSWFKGLNDADKATILRLRQDNAANASKGESLTAMSGLNEIFRKNVRDVTDTRNIFRTLPSLNFPRKLLVSAIASPGDLSKTSVIVENGLTLSDYSLSSQMVKVVQEFCNEELELPNKVHEWIDTSLILEGSKPILLMPSSAIDKVIGSETIVTSFESNKKAKANPDDWHAPLGLLAIPYSKDSKVAYSTESKVTVLERHNRSLHTIKGPAKADGTVLELPIMITDNPAILSNWISSSLVEEMDVESAYGGSALSFESRHRRTIDRENADKKEDTDRNTLVEKLFKPSARMEMSKRIQLVPTPKDDDLRSNVGHPIEIGLSADAVIPIGMPGDDGAARRFIVVLDRNGYPVSTTSKLDYYEDIRRASGSGSVGTDNSSVSGSMIANAAATVGAKVDSDISDVIIDSMVNIHTDLVLSDLIPRIKESMGGKAGEIEIGMSDATARIMLARTLKNQGTSLLYVPSEYMTYFAFEYDEVGVGKSILSDSKPMIGMAAVLTVANIMGSVENAIPGKTIRLKLDEADRDVLGSATFMAKEAMALAHRRFPNGSNTVTGLAEELQMSSTTVTVEGHPRFPDIEANVTAKESSHVPIDTELMTKLVDDINLVMFVTPEMTGSVNQSDFATTVVNNSIMLLKAVIEKQGIFNKHLSKYIRTYCKYSGVLVSRFYDIVENNKGSIPKEYKGEIDEFIKDFVSSLVLKLPSPETDHLSDRMESWGKLGTNIDSYLEVAISADALLLEGYDVESVAKLLPILRTAYKNHVLRQYARDRSLFPEFDIFLEGDEDSPMINLSADLSTHSKLVAKSVRKFLDTVLDNLKGANLKGIVLADSKIEEALAKIGGNDEPEVDDTDGGIDSFVDPEQAGDGPSELPEEEPLVDGEQEEEPLEEPTEPEDKPVEDDELNLDLDI